MYGLVAYFVDRRPREIGLRIALGATPVQVLHEVLVQGFGPALFAGGSQFLDESCVDPKDDSHFRLAQIKEVFPVRGDHRTVAFPFLP